MNPSRRTRTTCDRESRIVGTSGEIFSDGSAIELVKSATDRHLQLLFWRNQQKKVAPQIEHRGRLYQVPDADETLLQAIRFPSDALDDGTATSFSQGFVKFSRATLGSRFRRLRS